MKVYKFNHVFDHIEATLLEYYGDNPNFDDVLFVLGYNVLPSLQFLRNKFPGYKIVIYQLEQLHKGSPWVNRGCYETLKQADEIWDYDEGNIRWMQQNYKLNARLCPLRYTKSLVTMPEASEEQCDIDVLFYGYMHERRGRFMVQLQHAMSGKYKFFDLYGVWGKELEDYISRSKIILNIRSKDVGRQEQARIYYPAMNGRCVLSEVSPINYIGNAIVECKYIEMKDRVMSMLKSGEWLDVALNAKERYKTQSLKYTQKI